MNHKFLDKIDWSKEKSDHIWLKAQLWLKLLEREQRGIRRLKILEIAMYVLAGFWVFAQVMSLLLG